MSTQLIQNKWTHIDQMFLGVLGLDGECVRVT